MADTIYKRLDYDATLFLVNYMFQKLKASSLSDNTTYTIAKSADNRSLLLKDGDGNTVTTLENVLITNNNQITNGAGFQTASDVATAIQAALASYSTGRFQLVNTLPATGEGGVIYLVPNNGSGNNIKDEYLYADGKWEKIGTTEIDLSGYVQKANMAALTNAEITTIVDSAYTQVFGS